MRKLVQWRASENCYRTEIRKGKQQKPMESSLEQRGTKNIDERL